MRKILAFPLLLALPFTATAAPETTPAKKAIVVKIAPKSTAKITPAGKTTVAPVPVPTTQPATPAAPKVVITPKSATPASDIVVPGEPANAEEALAAVKKAAEYARVRNWFGLSSICILILIWVLKAAGLFARIGKRWIYIILPVFGVASMLLAKFVDSISWENAWIVFTSAPAMGLLSDFVKRGILGKEYETPMKVAKDPLPPTKGSIG